MFSLYTSLQRHMECDNEYFSLNPRHHLFDLSHKNTLGGETVVTKVLYINTYLPILLYTLH